MDKLKHTQQKAFTLIEVLVVVLLIGIAVSFITVSFKGGNQDKKLEAFAKQLQALCQHALDHAVFNSEELGMIVNQVDQEYFFVILNDEKNWVKFDAEKTFRARALLPNLTFDISLEGEAVDISNEQSQKNIPQVLFLSSGELIPFEIRLLMPDVAAQYKLKGDFSGKLTLLKNDEEF